MAKVDLTNVPDNQRVTLTLSNVNGSFSPSPLTPVFGWCHEQHAISQRQRHQATKARSGKATDGSNLKFDLNTSGSLDAIGASKVKATSGMTSP